ncbi:MAG: SDR family oxidoreductase [bacterium]|nr:SDR family oxidoreductase [bacterium]
MRGLKDKRVLVTGGASGIGASIAKRFLADGAKVVVADINEEALKEIIRELPDLSGTIKADVSDHEQVKKIFEELDNVFGGIDILINNAGISIRHKFVDITPEEWRQVMSVNLDGVFFVAQQAAKSMLKNENGGVILNMGSTNGIAGYPLYVDYNCSKAGVIELSRSLAIELAPKIRVNAICPGYILTPMQEAEYTPEMLKECASKVPLERLGQPKEVAALFAFLASENGAWITGQTFVIDGGELAGGLASQNK